MVDHAVDDYVVASPDYDIFTEQCSDQNVDLCLFTGQGQEVSHQWVSRLVQCMGLLQ